MNERTMRDRFHAMGPLVLRVGIAVVLLQSGIQNTAELFQRADVPGLETADSTTLAVASGADVTPERVNFSLDWATILGIGELGTAGLLLIGLVTRLVVLPMLAVLAYGMTVGFPAALPPVNATTMLLLGVAGLSLFVSGGGCLAVRRRRRHPQTTESAPVRKKYEEPREFVRTRRPVTQRVRDWFSRRRGGQPAYAMPLKRRRWWG